MIDTIKIYLPRTSVYGHWNIDSIASRLTDPVYKARINGYKYEGRIKNFFVDLYDNGIYIEGSLPKYYYGNNIKTLTFEDTIKAIDQLREEIKLPIWRAEVKRLDFGRNLLLDTPIKNCLDSLIDTPHYTSRQRFRTTVNYNKKRPSKALVIYDKLTELQCKKKTRKLFEFLSEELEQNVLRYEVQLKEEVAVSLKYNSVKLVHLMSRTFNNKINDYWFEEIKSIYTEQRVFIDLSKVPFESIDEEIYAIGSKVIGLDNLLNYYEDKRQKGIITSNKKSNKKKKILNAIRLSKSFQKTDSIEELYKELEFLHDGKTNERYKILENLVF